MADAPSDDAQALTGNLPSELSPNSDPTTGCVLPNDLPRVTTEWPVGRHHHDVCGCFPKRLVNPYPHRYRRKDGEAQLRGTHGGTLRDRWSPFFLLLCGNIGVRGNVGLPDHHRGHDPEGPARRERDGRAFHRPSNRDRFFRDPFRAARFAAEESEQTGLHVAHQRVCRGPAHVYCRFCWTGRGQVAPAEIAHVGIHVCWTCASAARRVTCVLAFASASSQI